FLDQPGAVSHRERIANRLIAAAHSWYVGKKEEPVYLESSRNRNGHLIRIDIVEASATIAGNARNDRQIAMLEQCAKKRRIRTHRLTHCSQLSAHRLGFCRKRIHA